MDQRDKSKLLISDTNNKAVRTVDVNSLVSGTFVMSNSLKAIGYMTQDEKSGDLYVTAIHAVYRIRYLQRTVSLLSGLGSQADSRDSTLLNSLFTWPHGLIFISHNTLLVADVNNNKLRLDDMNADKVTTLNVRPFLNPPYSLLLTKNSLYVGYHGEITQ